MFTTGICKLTFLCTPKYLDFSRAQFLRNLDVKTVAPFDHYKAWNCIVGS